MDRNMNPCSYNLKKMSNGKLKEDSQTTNRALELQVETRTLEEFWYSAPDLFLLRQ